MATVCEECGKTNPHKYPRGPFVGSPMELDYCVHCSADLCNDCMRENNCDEGPDGVHERYDEESEDDE